MFPELFTFMTCIFSKIVMSVCSSGVMMHVKSVIAYTMYCAQRKMYHCNSLRVGAHYDQNIII
jgi:hypothetical protein